MISALYPNWLELNRRDWQLSFYLKLLRINVLKWCVLCVRACFTKRPSSVFEKMQTVELWWFFKWLVPWHFSSKITLYELHTAFSFLWAFPIMQEFLDWCSSYLFVNEWRLNIQDPQISRWHRWLVCQGNISPFSVLWAFCFFVHPHKMNSNPQFWGHRQLCDLAS